MKAVIAGLALAIAFSATMAQADPDHHRHHMVCHYHHHHKVCHRG
jgi:hypothetical protein